jgi:hypothetical protein
MWFGLAVELAKIPVGIISSVSMFTDVLNDAVTEIHGDMTRHFNFKLQQRDFHEEVAQALETLTEPHDG